MTGVQTCALPILKWFWDHYCPDVEQRKEAYASPLLADDLSNLPKALIVTAEFDPLRDEGIEYALRLLQAGVNVELHSYPGTFHGSSMANPSAAICIREREELHAALRRGLSL